LLGDLLSAMGYEVAKAFQGQEALQKVAAHPPDLILLDVMMPKMDGYEVCRRLKENEKTRLIPIVMLTALRDLENRIKGIEAGADDFLNVVGRYLLIIVGHKISGLPGSDLYLLPALFMVVTDDGKNQSERSERFAYPLACHRMFSHNLPFLWSQPGWLEQDMIRNDDLSNIVQYAASSQSLQIFFGESD
ncbi:putative two-component system response regulator, partial [Candidatus Hakubella thermalkaliphila]